jgi:hypothetical protein
MLPPLFRDIEIPSENDWTVVRGRQVGSEFREFFMFRRKFFFAETRSEMYSCEEEGGEVGYQSWFMGCYEREVVGFEWDGGEDDDISVVGEGEVGRCG